MLKQIMRMEFSDAAARFPDEYAALELRIDQLALAAIDLFKKCRERIYEIKANESRRMNFVSQRMHSN
jgi:hypothetical protein